MMTQDRVLVDKGNILIVDDQLDNLRVLSTILTEEGYQVRKALNGQMALIACQTLPPDLILLDINMPDMDGYEVCSRLKANSETRDIPVIFISVLDDVFDKVKGIRIGGADYITKPFQFDEVVARVQNQLTIQHLSRELHTSNRKLSEQNALLRLEIEKRSQVETALQEANTQLQQLVWVDSVTGVANRRNLDRYLQREWQRSARERLPLSLIFCDIDNFQSYNHTYGHLAGDNCLKQIANAIANAVRRPADLVARYGNPEFAVILPNTTSHGAVQVADNIQSQVQALKICNSESTVAKYITLSIGVATLVPDRRVSPEILVAASDKALYQAKMRGCDRGGGYISISRDFFLQTQQDEAEIKNWQHLHIFNE